MRTRRSLGVLWTGLKKKSWWRNFQNREFSPAGFFVPLDLAGRSAALGYFFSVSSESSFPSSYFFLFLWWLS